MRFRILKQWKGLPETKQPATQEVFTSEEAANKVIEKLQPQMPGREFKVIQEREEE